MKVAELDAMPEREASRLLTECCGASRWVSTMVARRPFRSSTAVLSAADDIWRSLAPADWVEAFSHHPRIGAQRSTTQQSKLSEAWAAGEQSGVQAASEDIRVALAWTNGEYERRFGYIYIVCATGKNAEEMLSLARQRLTNDPDTELLIAAEEQRKIIELRLEKLLSN